MTRATLDFTFSKEALPFALHIVNPRTTSWEDIISVAAKELKRSDGKEVQLVRFAKWIEAIEKDVEQKGIEKAIERNPAVKLLDFYRGIFMASQGSGGSGKDKEDKVPREALGTPKLSTVQAQRLSATMRECPPIDGKEAKSWMKFWKEIGFLR